MFRSVALLLLGLLGLASAQLVVTPYSTAYYGSTYGTPTVYSTPYLTYPSTPYVYSSPYVVSPYTYLYR